MVVGLPVMLSQAMVVGLPVMLSQAMVVGLPVMLSHDMDVELLIVTKLSPKKRVSPLTVNVMSLLKSERFRSL